MVQFAVAFPDPELVAALGRQLGWAHFKLLIPLNEPLKRTCYAEMCRVEGWSTRTLAQKIDGMLFCSSSFERTALSKKPEQVIRQERSRKSSMYGSWKTAAKSRPASAVTDEESDTAPLGLLTGKSATSKRSVASRGPKA